VSVVVTDYAVRKQIRRQKCRMLLFVEESLHAVYSWGLPSWHIPTENELSLLEALICQPGQSDTKLSATVDGVFYYPEANIHHVPLSKRLFFSATAFAIDFSE
jgi:hypothetical protein